jgi:hypothetical protein
MVPVPGTGPRARLRMFRNKKMSALLPDFFIKTVNNIEFNIPTSDCVMDSGAILSEAVAYTQETFMGKWTRWIIFIILGLPTALFPFVFDMTKIMDSKTGAINWDMVAWDQVAIVVAAAFLLSFFLAGYAVRIYRGTNPAPDFDNWGSMFLDGVKMSIVTLIWFLPLLIVLLCVLGISFVGMASGGTGSIGLFLGVLLLAILIEIIVCIVIVLFSAMGVIRFARTGSIREGLRYTKILELIRTIGWGQYIIALVILFVATIIFGIIGMVLQLIPYIGWIGQLIITPLFMVFAARYYTLVYEWGEQPAV